MLRIKLVKSPIGHTSQNRSIVKALGLRKVQHTVEHEDTPSIRGMVHKIKNLLVVEEIAGEAAPAAPKTKGTAKAESSAAVDQGVQEKEAAPKRKPTKAAATAQVSE
jgi:large subunit ribosomal protein L30